MENSSCGICKTIASCQAHSNPDFICELPNSYVVLGNRQYQYYKRYCIVLFKQHKTELFDMTSDERKNYFDEISLVAKAIWNLSHPDKLNYEILGNQEPHLHCHIFPRKKSDEFFRLPIWSRPEDKIPKIQLTPQELQHIISDLRNEIDKLRSNIS